MVYFEAPTDESARLDPSELVVACIESGADRLLIDHGALPPAFFDLSSRIAGELAGRIALYGIRTGIVVPDLAIHSRLFQEFAGEADRAGQIRFFRTRQAAAEWLGGAPA